jgi:ribonuclease HI
LVLVRVTLLSEFTFAFNCVTDTTNQSGLGKQVQIYCDGSSLGNGQVTSRAAAVALLGYKGIWRAVGEYLGVATNQQAEIVAAAIGLESLREPCTVELFTDSKYVVETMCGRFRKKSNHEWWKRLDKAAGRHQVDWQWTRGHAGHPLQEAADATARQIAAAQKVEEYMLRDAIDRIGTTE